jgi:hypothetical protein
MNRKTFITALKNIYPAVDKVPNALGTHLIGSDTKFLYGFNTFIGFRAPFPSDIRGSFSPEKILKILPTWTDEEITIKGTDTSIIFRGKKATLTIPLIDSTVVSQFHTHYNIEKKYNATPADFTDMLLRAIIPHNEKLPGVYVTGCNIVSSNNSVVHNAIFEGNVETFRVSEKVIGILSKYGVKGVLRSESWIQWDTEEGVLLTRSWTDEDYPYDQIRAFLAQYENVVPSGEFITPSTFLDTIRNAMSVIDESATIRLMLNDNSLTIQAKGVEGEFEESAEVAEVAPAPFKV